MTKYDPSDFPFATYTTYHPELHSGEVNNGVSMTVPDMSLTVPEILYKYATNRPVGVNNNLSYTGDEVLPDMSRLDKLEQIDWLRKNTDQIVELQNKLDEIDKKSKAREASKTNYQKAKDIIAAHEASKKEDDLKKDEAKEAA